MPRRKKKKPLGLPPFVVLKRGRWHVRRGFPTPHRDSSGRVVYLQITRRCDPETLRRAAEIAAFIEQEVRDAAQQMPSAARTVGEFFQAFLAAKRGSVTRRTFEFYLHLYERHLEKHNFSRRPLPGITVSDVQDFYASLRTTPGYVRKLHILVNMAFKQAVIWGLLDRNPAVGVILPRHRPKESAAMTPEESKRFLAVCLQDPKYLIFQFALETGLRPQEVLALKWSDLDLASCTVRVTKALAQGFHGGGFEIKEPKTKSSRRTVTYSPLLAERLAAECRVVDRDHLVFPNSRGGYRNKDNLNARDFKNVLKLAGIDPAKYSFRSLRHSYATLLAGEGLHPKKLQSLLGHSDPRTAQQFYVHMDDGCRDEAAEKISRVLYE